MKHLLTNPNLRLTLHRVIRAALVATMLCAAPLGLPSLSHAQKLGVSPEEKFTQPDIKPDQESLQKQISELEANLCAEPPQTSAQVPTVDPIQSQMEATTGCLDCATEQALAQTRPQGVLDQVGELLVPVEEALKKERIQSEVEFFRYYSNLTMGGSLPDWMTGTQRKLELVQVELKFIEAGIKSNSASLNQMQAEKKRWIAQISAIEKLEIGRALDTAEKQRLGEVDLIKHSFQSAKGSLSHYEEMYKNMIDHPFLSTSYIEEFKHALEKAKKKAELQAELESEWSNLEAWSQGKEGAPPPSQTMRDTLKIEIENQIEDHEANLTYAKKYRESLHQQAAAARAKIKELEQKLADEKKQQETDGAGSTAKMTSEEEHAKFEEHFKDHANRYSNNPNISNCGMSIAETLAVSHYSANGYLELNSALREGGEKKEKLEPFAKVLDAALKKLRPYEGIANRGGNLPADLLEKHQIEAIVTYQAFTSSSVASGFHAKHRFTILSKSGRYIAPFSFNSAEQEVLFSSNTKFKVLAREENEPGGVHFILEEVLESEE